MGHRKRSWTRVLFDRRLQIEAGFWVPVGAFLLTGLYVLWILRGLIDAVARISDAASASAVIETEILPMSWTILWVFLGVSIALFLLTLVLSQQVMGPIYRFEQHLRRLIEGDFSARTHLRKADQFKEIAGLLNELSEKLDQGGIAKKPPASGQN